MSVSTLMLRAKKLLQSRAGAATAMVIVPLATAVPGWADSVLFQSGSAFVSASGGSQGHASEALVPATLGVHLAGDTIAYNNGYLTGAIYDANSDALAFNWNGGFAQNSDFSPGDTFSALYSDMITLEQGDSAANEVSWTLNISLNDSDNNEVIGLSTSGSGFGPASGALMPPDSVFTTSGQLVSWWADLTIDWVYSDSSDQLSVTPSIDLSVVAAGSAPAGSAVPLPRAVWAGGTLLGGLGLFQIRRRRKPAPAG